MCMVLYRLYLGFVLFPHAEATWLQDQISRLNQENGSLKQNLTSTNTALKEARTDLSRASNNNAIKVDTAYCNCNCLFHVCLNGFGALVNCLSTFYLQYCFLCYMTLLLACKVYYSGRMLHLM